MSIPNMDGPKTLNDIYRRACCMASATLASWQGRSLTYQDAFVAASRLAEDLREQLTVVSGARIGIALSDPFEWIISFIAVTSLGASAVLLMDGDVDLLDRLSKAARCHLLLADSFAPDFTGRQVLRIGRDLDIGSDLRDTDKKQRLAAIRATAFGSQMLQPDFPALIAFTGGTTGLPKGVLLTHRNLTSGLMNMMLGAQLSPRDNGSLQRTPRESPRTLILHPLSYIGGYSQLLLALMIGGRIIVLKEWDVERAAHLIDSERVNAIPGINPAQALDLLCAKPNATSLASLGIQGTSIERHALREIARQWPSVHLHTGYGMTETAGPVAVTGGASLLNRPMSLGRILPTMDVRIVDDSGRDVDSGVIGEIWLSGASVMRGYCGESAGSERLSSGWFGTGDLGYLSVDRHISVLGRRNHAINAQGGILLVEQIERALTDEFSIAEVVVLDTSAGSGTRRLTAVIVPVRGSEDQQAAIVGHVRAMLGREPVWVDVVFRMELPRTRAGKIDRKTLELMLTS
jgi:long-chain acyl-CoA synthetase